MADRTVYVVSHKGTYKTNRTNCTRLWEVFQCEFGDQELEFAWQKNDGDEFFQTMPARVQKIKQLCLTAHNNRVHVYPVGEFDNRMSVFQDLIGGRD